MAETGKVESSIATKYKVEHTVSGYNANGNLKPGGNKFTNLLGWPSITAGVQGFVENRGGSSQGIQVFDPDFLSMREIFRMGRFILKIMKYPPFFPPVACEMARWLFEDQVRGVDGPQSNSLSTASIEIGATGRTVDYPGMYKENNKDLTLKVPEWKGRPLGKFSEWYLSALSDRETGIGTLYGRDMEYVKPNYGMTFLYIILGPDARPESIEFSCLYHECFMTEEINGYLGSNTLGDIGNVGEQDVKFSGIYQTGLQVDALAEIVTAQYGLYNETYLDMILPAYFYKGLLSMPKGDLEEVAKVVSVSNMDRLRMTMEQGVNDYDTKVVEVMEEVKRRALGDLGANEYYTKNAYPLSHALDRALLDVNERSSKEFSASA